MFQGGRAGGGDAVTEDGPRRLVGPPGFELEIGRSTPKG